MRGAWFHCFAGIAGDMALGSLVDAGADVDEVRSMLAGLEVPGWRVSAAPASRNGIRATRLLVETDEDGSIVRTFPMIRALLQNSNLPPRVLERSLAVFTKLAQVEARIHDTEIERVHFHEVGGLDAIVDIVGTCAALELLEVDRVFCSAISTGTGTIKAAHGELPVPVPAVVDLLAGAPMHGLDVPFELTTPTGAALVTAFTESFGAMPAMTQVTANGYGAGHREIEGLPNCTQVVIGTLEQQSALGKPGGQSVMLMEVNVDDVTGEVLAYAVDRLLEASAHDAWITPILMKKGRPGFTVSALCDVATAKAVADVMATETGSYGVRATMLQRWPLSRSMGGIDIDGNRISVKTLSRRHKVEYEEAAELARRTGRPLRDILHSVEEGPSPA